VYKLNPIRPNTRNPLTGSKLSKVVKLTRKHSKLKQRNKISKRRSAADQSELAKRLNIVGKWDSKQCGLLELTSTSHARPSLAVRRTDRFRSAVCRRFIKIRWSATHDVFVTSIDPLTHRIRVHPRVCELRSIGVLRKIDTASLFCCGWTDFDEIWQADAE